MMTIDDGLDIYLSDVSKQPVLSREEEVDLFTRLDQGDERVRERIINCNLRFVVKMALKYQGQGMALADLIQEGNMGLIEVVDKFDIRKGFRFSTYAAFWIKQSIQQALCKQSRLIRLPIRKSRMLGKIRMTAQSFVKKEGREPNIEEIARLVDMSPEQVEELTRFDELVVSLESSATEGGPTLEDMLSDDDSETPRTQAMDAEMRQRVRSMLKTLDAREKKILSLRFGFSSRPGQSLRTTSAFVGLSQEGVRRIEKRSLEKLARSSRHYQIAGLL